MSTSVEADLSVLSFESTVPRRYVHRQSVSEVFLTDCVTDSQPDRFVLGAQWPRVHAFYRGQAGRYDPMLLAETLRQCVIYLAHTRYRVSLRQHFVMQTIEIDAELDRLGIGAGAAEVAVTVVVSDVRRRGSQVIGLNAALTFEVAGRRVGSGYGRAAVLTAVEYEIARWGAAGPRAIGSVPDGVPLDAAAVGVPGSGDVVIGATTRRGRWQVLPDLSHPVLFDHPSDHLPGMLMLEAARQASRAEFGLPDVDMVSMSVQFHRFVELDCRAEMVVSGIGGEPGRAHVVLEQHGTSTASATLTLESATGARPMSGTRHGA
ncbi:ScbA/BarX family gamma-butyrolactone biosynthesis protein [Rhodococcus sp. SMB37]|uniref:ScbA/BarX family gamma-butyrolactone biosynthesis protein n=1 Tax=Rhodococcus sp. SMB37 TaxID=2512213 RepID=UPI001305074D|nr:ScbA/BarX family gamma-butyrolactone biosynthesis protein [Rhodococcus sp. SMB37]